MPIEKMYETRRISVMRGSTQVLVKVVLFQLRGRGHPQDDATPIFLLILNALYKGFQMRYHLFLNSFGMVTKVYTSYWAAQNIWRTLYVLKVKIIHSWSP